MMQSLPRTAYNIGKRFGNEKLTVIINSDFEEKSNYAVGGTSACSIFSKLNDGHLYVFLSVPNNASDEDKEIKIAHEFGEIKFKENHPCLSKALHIGGSIPLPLIGKIPKLINEALADVEARKRGFKIPYLYHLG